MSTNQRKVDHIDIVLDKQVDAYASVRDRYKLPFRSLPEIDLSEVDTSVDFFGRRISFPFVISSMTGGPEKGELINRHLAEACEQASIPLGLWSMRVIIEDPDTLSSFDVRKYCPTIPLFANLGLVQLNYGYSAEQINQLIDMIQADGIFLHINSLQEAVQPEGDTNFSNLIPHLETLLPQLHAPVVIKETGNGIDSHTAQQLADIGVKRIDVSGRGGTSRPAVEGYRRPDRLGKTIQRLWIPTDQALQQCSKIDQLDLIAGWGIRTWVDVAKALMLGASLATAASPFLAPALDSPNAVYDELQLRKKEYQIALFSTSSRTTDEFIDTVSISTPTAR